MNFEQKDRFEIEGGHRLQGEITPQGAKNEALQVISAVLLTGEPVTIHNIPDIVDVNNLIDLLRALGVVVEKIMEGSFTFTAREVDLDYMESEAFRTRGSGLRGSIMILGPLLARFGKGYIPKPGGDKIGRRRLDTHFLGFEQLGAQFTYDPDKEFFRVGGRALKGTNILLDEASVTGTANVLMAAVCAEGQTSIYNAACEPYIQQLCAMLNRMGARIDPLCIGSNLLRIEGVSNLKGTEHRLLPDFIEVGSFIGMAAMTQGEMTIKNAGIPHLGRTVDVFRRLGIQVDERGDDLFVPAQDHYAIDTFIDGSILTIADAPWPGLSPDLLSIVLTVATQAHGSVLIHQKMFESRLFFVDKLIDMGAQIILCDPHRATVIGLERKHALRGIKMTSPDIRAGVSLLIAALSAQGTSIIDHVHQIDRGYQQIEQRLTAVGAHLHRI
ncbi:MAG: UDP-N-acetylglucosamine 1-carboxyvinyltransferase [Bacteroidetes bacterium]|jgi:UDP-N-acetylglucosamine 1-carboxyvinyltransferase|nr:UDP-N-acetylglucosamine 1-carboxyvinyltransferase [Bacteroidota bacterium]